MGNYDGLVFGTVDRLEYDSVGHWTGRVYIHFDNLELPSDWAMYPSMGGNNDAFEITPTKGTRVTVGWTSAPTRKPVVLNSYRINDISGKTSVTTKRPHTEQGEKALQAVKVEKDKETEIEQHIPSASLLLRNDGSISLKSMSQDVDILIGSQEVLDAIPFPDDDSNYNNEDISPPGRYTISVCGGKYRLYVNKDGNVTVMCTNESTTVFGESNTFIGGNCTLHASSYNIILPAVLSIMAETLTAVLSGNATIEAEGDINLTAVGNINLTADGNVDVVASGDVNVDGASVNLGGGGAGVARMGDTVVVGGATGTITGASGKVTSG